MALTITQTPISSSFTLDYYPTFAQSPVIFTVAETNSGSLLSSSFQYVGELYFWTSGSTYLLDPSANIYTIVKYPNTAKVGIFDLNRILNSALTDTRQQNSSSLVGYKVDFYTQYLSGSTYFTGSHVTSSVGLALDGYSIFPTPIGQSANLQSPYFGLMTAGPATQSCFINNTGTVGLWQTSTGVDYSGSNGQNASLSRSGTSNLSQVVQQFPLFPGQSGFPLSGSLESYTVNAKIDVGAKIKFNIVCASKYPNIRIKWKNQFGQFDYMNFDMVSKQSFTTERRTYQPQLGTWESSTLSYQPYDTGNQAYIVDSKQMISVNTNWLSESYNDILKQLLVSDEIYWVYDEPTDAVRPLTIVTQNILFKTGVVDKLIQYQFDFQFGQPYKLIM
jgi:hypothetical protein